MRGPTLLPILLAITLAGCGAPAPQGVTVTDAWVRLPAVADRPAAGYFTVTSGQPDVLLSITTPATQRVELHESVDGAGMASMRPLSTVSLDKDEALSFAPGGKHIMLYDLGSSLQPGDTIDLVLQFAKAPTVTAKATLVAAGDAAPSE